MTDKKPVITEAVQRLMDMDTETVFASDIAPVLHMDERVILKHVRDGEWDPDRLGNYVMSGNRVKFFRLDFLQKCGFVEKEPEAPTEAQILQAVINAIEIMLKTQKEVLLLLNEQNELLREQIKKTAGAATPTE